MLSSTVALIGITLLMALGTWLVFLIALKSGQFKDVENTKYRMLEDDSENEDKSCQEPQVFEGHNSKEIDRGGKN